MPFPSTSPANDVWLSMIRIVQQVSRAGGDKLRERGLSAAQFELLAQVHAHPGFTQQDLAGELGVTKGNISQHISKLEADDLLRRTAQGAAFTLELTPAGRVLMQEMLPDYDAFISAQFAALSKTELKTLRALLARIEQG